MGKIKKIMTNWRVLLLLLFLIFSYLSLNGGAVPHFWEDGATIRSVAQDSSAVLAGISSPSPKLTPLQKERIVSVNGQSVDSAATYYTLERQLSENSTVRLKTDLNDYVLLTKSSGRNGTVDLGLRVYDSPTSNLRKGLDLEGGTRVLLKPAEPVSKDTIELTAANLRERLNVYGLSDIIVRPATDLSGNYFVLIEIAGVTESEVKDLLARQGKFEAKINNQTVFRGGENDITYVCRSAECSGIDAYQGCSQGGDGYLCRFFFAISLSPEAAERQADATKNLGLATDSSGNYLDQDLLLYLDDVQVDQLKIGAELRGKATTNVQISGSGTGRTEQEAITNTLENMKRLQTVIITGSLPVKLDVVKMDTISPTLGQEFLNNIFFVGLIALVAVSAVVILRYRRVKIVVPMVLTLLSEIILILGFSALTGTNFDLAAIAGIIIVIGSGVNHLIIITDGTLGGQVVNMDWKARIKNAMAIVFGAYLVNFAGLIPLWFAGAGILKGFALTTIVGASFGVLVARPAFAAVIEILLKDEEGQ